MTKEDWKLLAWCAIGSFVLVFGIYWALTAAFPLTCKHPRYQTTLILVGKVLVPEQIPYYPK